MYLVMCRVWTSCTNAVHFKMRLWCCCHCRIAVAAAAVLVQAQAKREDEEKKRQEQLARKAELKRLQEEEEAALARPKPSPKANRVSGPKVGEGGGASVCSSMIGFSGTLAYVYTHVHLCSAYVLTKYLPGYLTLGSYQ